MSLMAVAASKTVTGSGPLIFVANATVRAKARGVLLEDL